MIGKLPNFKEVGTAGINKILHNKNIEDIKKRLEPIKPHIPARLKNHDVSAALGTMKRNVETKMNKAGTAIVNLGMKRETQASTETSQAEAPQEIATPKTTSAEPKPRSIKPLPEPKRSAEPEKPAGKKPLPPTPTTPTQISPDERAVKRGTKKLPPLPPQKSQAPPAPPRAVPNKLSELSPPTIPLPSVPVQKKPTFSDSAVKTTVVAKEAAFTPPKKQLLETSAAQLLQKRVVSQLGPKRSAPKPPTAEELAVKSPINEFWKTELTFNNNTKEMIKIFSALRDYYIKKDPKKAEFLNKFVSDVENFKKLNTGFVNKLNENMSADQLLNAYIELNNDDRYNNAFKTLISSYEVGFSKLNFNDINEESFSEISKHLEKYNGLDLINVKKQLLDKNSPQKGYEFPYITLSTQIKTGDWTPIQFIQRAPRYGLLLKEMLKNLPEGNLHVKTEQALGIAESNSYALNIGLKIDDFKTEKNTKKKFDNAKNLLETCLEPETKEDAVNMKFKDDFISFLENPKQNKDSIEIINFYLDQLTKATIKPKLSKASTHESKKAAIIEKNKEILTALYNLSDKKPSLIDKTKIEKIVGRFYMSEMILKSVK